MTTIGMADCDRERLLSYHYHSHHSCLKFLPTLTVIIVIFTSYRGKFASANINDEVLQLLEGASSFAAACGERRDSELREHVVRDDDVDSILPKEQQQQWDACNLPRATELAEITLRTAGSFVGLPTSLEVDEFRNPNVNAKNSQISIMMKNGNTKSLRIPQQAFITYRRAQNLYHTLHIEGEKRTETVTAAAKILDLAHAMHDLCKRLSEEALY